MHVCIYLWNPATLWAHYLIAWIGTWSPCIHPPCHTHSQTGTAGIHVGHTSLPQISSAWLPCCGTVSIGDWSCRVLLTESVFTVCLPSLPCPGHWQFAKNISTLEKADILSSFTEWSGDLTLLGVHNLEPSSFALDTRATIISRLIDKSVESK